MTRISLLFQDYKFLELEIKYGILQVRNRLHQTYPQIGGSQTATDIGVTFYVCWLG